MIRLPRLDRASQARILANYHAALEQRALPFLVNERPSPKQELETAFALGITCGLALAAESAQFALEGEADAHN